MDNAELRKIIDQYVDDRYYDKDKLLQCLSFVKSSIYASIEEDTADNADKPEDQKSYIYYVDKKSLPGGKQAHSRYLDSDSGYYPLHKESFIDRMPFYFYMPDTQLKRQFHC